MPTLSPDWSLKDILLNNQEALLMFLDSQEAGDLYHHGNLALTDETPDHSHWLV